jgi:hypothetical protein
MKSAIVVLTLALLASAARATPAIETDKKDVVPSTIVQSSKGFHYEHGKLTLEGVSPSTVLLAERPERLAGHAPTDDIVAGWSEGPDSFQKDPPNADFSTLTDEGAKNVVLQLRNPRLDGDQLTYDVRVVQGRLARHGGESSIFIDLVGRPTAPGDGGEAAKRLTRRAVFFR